MVDLKRFKEFEYYETEIDTIKQELKILPDGYLVKRGAFYYAKAGPVQNGITKDWQKVMQLARKAYLLRRLENLEWNYSLAQKQCGKYKTEDPAEIIQSLPSLYQMLPVKCFFHTSVHSQLEKFEKAIVGEAGHVDRLIYMTDSGINVRSKSELIIANALYQNGIPYRYEAALALGGENRYPDFTICRPSDGKVFIWEHLGLMDQDIYRQRNIEKLSLYARYGFLPFDNLICTYEHDIKNPAQIHRLIKVHLLCQM